MKHKIDDGWMVKLPGMTLDFSETTKAVLRKDAAAVKESDDDWY